MSQTNPSPLPVRQSSNLTPSFPFLSLPTELRLQIYAHLLLDSASYIMPIARLPPQRLNKSKSLQPAILRVSRAIHDEALPILYGSNTFWIRTFPMKFCTPSLTAYIGKNNTGLIRRVFVTMYVRDVARREEIEKLYNELGIEFEKLHVWAARTKEESVVEVNLREQGEWLFRADQRDLRVLNVDTEWFDFGDPWTYVWLVKKGSMPRIMSSGERVGLGEL